MTAHRGYAVRRGTTWDGQPGWAARCHDCEAITFGGAPTRQAAIRNLDHDVEDKNAPEAAPTATEGESKSRANGSQNDIPTITKEQNVMSIIPQTTDNGNDDAEQHVHIPFVSPELAAWERIAESDDITASSSDLDDIYLNSECPVWCIGAHTPIRAQEHGRVHLSEAVTLRLNGKSVIRKGIAYHPHLEIRAEKMYLGENYSPRIVIGLRRQENTDGRAVWNETTVLNGSVKEARRLYDTLGALIRLVDPDGEFDAAAPKTEA